MEKPSELLGDDLNAKVARELDDLGVRVMRSSHNNYLVEMVDADDNVLTFSTHGCGVIMALRIIHAAAQKGEAMNKEAITQ